MLGAPLTCYEDTLWKDNSLENKGRYATWTLCFIDLQLGHTCMCSKQRLNQQIWFCFFIFGQKQQFLSQAFLSHVCFSCTRLDASIWAFSSPTHELQTSYQLEDPHRYLRDTYSLHHNPRQAISQAVSSSVTELVSTTELKHCCID